MEVDEQDIGCEVAKEKSKAEQNSEESLNLETKDKCAVKNVEHQDEVNHLPSSKEELTPNGDLKKGDVSSGDSSMEELSPKQGQCDGDDEELEDDDDDDEEDDADAVEDDDDEVAIINATDIGKKDGEKESKRDEATPKSHKPKLADDESDKSKSDEVQGKIESKAKVMASSGRKGVVDKDESTRVKDSKDEESTEGDSDDQVLATLVQPSSQSKSEDGIKHKSEKEASGKTDKRELKSKQLSKEQTIIVTETKSLAQAINEAVKKPDGKPTLVIIETKSPANANSNGVVTTTTASSPAKSIVKMSPAHRATTLQPAPNSLRSALLQGSSGMVMRSQNRPILPQPRLPIKNDGAQGTPLKDDAEVNVYTPSLLVPYLFECPPKESLSEFLKKIAPPDVIKAEEERKKKEQEELDDCEPPLPKPKKNKTFFDTALGMFFIDIGLNQVQQWVQAEILKSQKKKLDRGWKTKERESMVLNLEKTLTEIQLKTEPFKFSMKKCKRCNFVTESKTVLERHLETIHVNGTKMLCSFCDFETSDPSQIFHHLYTQHKAFGRLERPPTNHMCPLCPFEDSAKVRVTRHSWKCVKTFVPDKNLAPSPDFEPPGKRVRHVASVATLKAMRGGVEKAEAMAGSSSHAGGTSLLSPLLTQQQPHLQLAPRGPPPIRPKPGDLRLTPTYVQSVLRGSYSSALPVRGISPSTGSTSQSLPPPPPYVRPSVPPRIIGQPQVANSFLAPRQTSTITPISTSNSFTLQGNQLYQVLHASGANVPVVRNAGVGSFTPPRFTILPTPPVTVNTRGPTPVALIPNLATTNKPVLSTGTSITSGGAKVLSSSTFSTTMRPITTVSSTSHGSQASRSASQISSKPNISITPVSKPVPARSSATPSSTLGSKLTSTSSASPQTSRPQQQSSNPSVVVCEICDGYIKDLDQLRNHMQWIHKVKIHPKMIHNRPPLNCQKCHFRFFTDQGLERHLLGSHGLVTSSMQENANKGKDGGRCIICGKVFLWKLVVHMAKDHKMTLKPAHLSYKCTVCSATFNMYRLFETHVYEEHSTVAKRVLDGQKSYTPSSSLQSLGLTNKSKVTITPTSASASSSSSSAPSATPRKTTTTTTTTTTSATTTTSVEKSTEVTVVDEERCLSPNIRSCVECGIEFQRPSNCIRHWEKTHLKPCQVKLCRVDKCEQCIAKKAAEGEDGEEVEEESYPSPNGKLAEGRPLKRQHDETNDENEPINPNPVKKSKMDVEHLKEETKHDQSDGDDVFDMEVETVDDDHPSPDYVNTDVESD